MQAQGFGIASHRDHDGRNHGYDTEEQFNLSAEQQSAARRVLKHEANVFLTGPAGTGKSYLLRYIISKLRAQHRSCRLYVTATTGVAASNIKGTTIHSFAGIGLGAGTMETLCHSVMSRNSAVSRWLNITHLVVDEVSMLHAELFEKLEYIARTVRRNEKPFGGIQLILCGDFFQLPPVERRAKKGPRFAFQSPVWDNCKIQTITLQQVQRQAHGPFITLLNEIRIGTLSEKSSAILERCHAETKALPEDGILPTRLYCLNRNVDAENSLHLNKLPGPDALYTGRDDWAPRSPAATTTSDYGRTKQDVINDLDKKCPLQIRLRVGAQVMYTKNDPKRNLINGSRGVVTQCDTTHPTVRFDNGGVFPVHLELTAQSCAEGKVLRYHLPLKLAWALTVHKSQGMTLTRAEVQLDNAFEVGQVYVALSRVRSLEGLYLRGGHITPAVVAADPQVMARFGGGALVPAATDEPEQDLPTVDRFQAPQLLLRPEWQVIDAPQQPPCAISSGAGGGGSNSSGTGRPPRPSRIRARSPPSAAPPTSAKKARQTVVDLTTPDAAERRCGSSCSSGEARKGSLHTPPVTWSNPENQATEAMTQRYSPRLRTPTVQNGSRVVDEDRVTIDLTTPAKGYSRW